MFTKIVDLECIDLHSQQHSMVNSVVYIITEEESMFIIIYIVYFHCMHAAVKVTYICVFFLTT